MDRDDGEQTSALLARLPGVHALTLEVVSTQVLTSSMRRLRLAGDGLETMDAFAGQDLMVTVPAPGRTHFRRRYTMRHLRQVAGEVDLDVVVHGEGPGARWATSATPGETVEAVGPRGKIGLAEHRDWHLFCGDESAVPAIFSMIEALPADSRAIVGLEVGGPDDELAPEDPRCQLALDWLHRTSEPGTGRALAEWVGQVTLPPGGGHAYVFGELHQVAAARAALVERGVDPVDIAHKAYWRRGTANAAHGEPRRPDPS